MSRGERAPAADSVERAVLERIGPEPLIALLREWIPLRSDGGRESPMQRAVAVALEQRGLRVEVRELDLEALRAHPAWSAEIERSEGLGVLGRLSGSGGGRSLLLNGHVDVVPAGDESLWTRPPWSATVESDRVYGRGACDMKGGLACAVVAAGAICDSGVRLAGDLMVQSVIGEEDGGCGSLAAAIAGQRADAAIIAEPTGLDVATAQAGALNFRLHVRGRAAHAAVRYEGVSAVDKLEPLLAALRSLEERLNRGGGGPLFESWPVPFPLSVGVVRAGDWASTVPDALVCEGRLGVPVDGDVGEARRGLEDAIAAAAAADPWLAGHPPRVEWWGGQYEPAAIPADHEIVGALAGALAEVAGKTPRVLGVPYGSDLRLLVRQAGTPAVLFGPGDLRRAHAADEFVPVDELVACARALALVALRFCGTAPGAPAG